MQTYEYKLTSTTDFMSAHQTWLVADRNLSEFDWYVRSHVRIGVGEGEAPRFDIMLVADKEIDLATVYERLSEIII